MAEGGGEQKASVGTAAVFISYASQDATVAEWLCAALEAAGLPCWIAPRDVRAGESYAAAIVEAINSCRMLILLLSQDAIDSPHVLREVERASSKRRAVLSVRMDAAKLPPDLEYFLSANQWLDASGRPIEQILPALIECVRNHAGGTSGQAFGVSRPAVRSALAAVPPPAPSKPSSRWRKPAMAVALVIAAVGLGYVLTTKLGLSKRTTTEQPTTPATNVVNDKSIAVLPFADMSEKKDQEYFGDGMAEEILDLLTKIKGITVIGRTSSFQFKGKNEDLRTIGAKLNAAYVLEGSVRKSVDQVRITAQLINTQTGTHEWSETYDRHIGDVLKLQENIAAAVVRELQLTVTPGYLNSRSSVKNAEAYDLYLRGLHAADRSDIEGSDESVALFQQALDRDPTFADAAAQLAGAYVGQVALGSLAPTIGFAQARRAAAAALKLDPKSAEAHAALSAIHIFYDWDWAAAGRELQQAMTVAPSNVNVLVMEATLSYTLGHWDDASRQINAALAEDPLNPSTLNLLSGIQQARGHLPEAEAAMRRALDIRPAFGYGHYNLGLLSLERGDSEGALREMQQEAVDDGKQQGLALTYYALGRKAEADAALAGLLKDQAAQNALGIAEVYAFRGQSDEAMRWLEQAYAKKEFWLYYAKSDWLLKNLVGDPRYEAFLRKMNLLE